MPNWIGESGWMSSMDPASVRSALGNMISGTSAGDAPETRHVGKTRQMRAHRQGLSPCGIRAADIDGGTTASISASTPHGRLHSKGPDGCFGLTRSIYLEDRLAHPP